MAELRRLFVEVTACCHGTMPLLDKLTEEDGRSFPSAVTYSNEGAKRE